MTLPRILTRAALCWSSSRRRGAGNAAQSSAIEEAQGTNLEAGRLADAAATLDGHLRNSPEDDAARFALGTVQFMRATERLGQSLYRHGLEPSPEVFAMPFFPHAGAAQSRAGAASPMTRLAP